MKKIKVIDPVCVFMNTPNHATPESYRFSWEALMSVVDKIHETTINECVYKLIIENKKCTIVKNSEFQERITDESSTKEAVYKSVVKILSNEKSVC